MNENERSDDELEQVELEIPDVTAPVMPTEHTLNNSHTFYQRTIGGGMLLKFVPLVARGDGSVVPAPEAYVVAFSPEGWERFKREVSLDGVTPPRVETVRTFPGGLLNGGA